jgi:hypothetical protein
MVVLNVISSAVFATNVMAAYWKNDLRYSLMTGFLMTTSVFHHWLDSNYMLMVIDKMAVYAIIVYACMQTLKKKMWAMHNLCATLVGIISTNIIAILYFYGSYTQSFCFHPDFGCWYHGLMHCFSSLSHHCVLLLH